MKTALLFVDDGLVKIVIGNTLKTIKFSEVDAEHNQGFLDQLFSSAKVLVVDKASELTRESFDDFATDVQNPHGSEVKAEIQAAPKATEQRIQRQQAIAAQDDGTMLFRSLDETTIIVDDFPTDEDIPDAPGAKKSLVIRPDKALNLANFDPERIKKSNYLKRLIREGRLVPCTPAEADRMEREHSAKLMEDDRARTDASSPIIPDGISAVDFARMQSTGSVPMNAPSVEISIDEPQPRIKKGGKPAIEDMEDISSSMTMDQLMELVGSEDERPVESQPIPRPNRRAAGSGGTGPKMKAIARRD